ncbi:hypothetical protein [Caballeronia hypogeia]|nr:hypothetical protein [Caballeronia hypogeia]
MADALDQLLQDLLTQADKLRFQKPVGLLQAMESQDMDVWADAVGVIHELGAKLDPAIEADLRFPGDAVRQISDGRGSFRLYPRVGATLMIQALKRQSAEAAVGWLLKMLGTKSTTGWNVQTLWGAPVKQGFDLTDEVRLVPLKDLPEGEQKRQIEKLSAQGTMTSLTSFISLRPFDPRSSFDVKLTHSYSIPKRSKPNQPRSFLKITIFSRNLC